LEPKAEDAVALPTEDDKGGHKEEVLEREHAAGAEPLQVVRAARAGDPAADHNESAGAPRISGASAVAVCRGGEVAAARRTLDRVLLVGTRVG
jgi:hypothetical protein